MPYFTWKEEMSVGLARLDDDHKALIAIINRLAAAVEDARRGAPMAPGIIDRTLQDLIRYTEYHFGREEAVLEATGYRTLREHQMKHHRFVDDLRELRATRPGGGDLAYSLELLDFLRHWLTRHIMVEDQSYRDLVHGDPAAAKAAERFTGIEQFSARLAAGD